MTKFLSHHKLLDSCIDRDNMLDLSPGKDPDNVIITYSKNIAFVVKIGEQKPLHSWGLPKKFISKVIYDQKVKLYVAAFANGRLRLWDGINRNINKCWKKRFRYPMLALVSSKWGSFILCKDNTCKSLMTVLKTRRDKQQTNKQQANDLNNSLLDCNLKIYDTNVHKLKNGKFILSYYQLNLQNYDCDFIIMPIEEQNSDDNDNSKKLLKIKRYPITNRSKSNGFATARIIDTLVNGPSLITIRNDGKMYLENLSTLDSGNYMATIPYLIVDRRINGYPSITLNSLSNDYLLLSGTSDSNSNKYSIIIYNTTFKLAKARRNFRKEKTDQNTTRIWKINDYLFVKIYSSLYVIRYSIKPHLLSEFIGIDRNLMKTKKKKMLIVSNEDDVMESYFRRKKLKKSAHRNDDYLNDGKSLIKQKNSLKNNNNNNKQQEIIQSAGNHRIEKLRRRAIKRKLYTKKNTKKNTKKKALIFSDGKFIPYKSTTEFYEHFRKLTRTYLSITITREKRLAKITIKGFKNHSGRMFSDDKIEQLAIKMEKNGKSDEEISTRLLYILQKKYQLNDIHVCLKRYSITTEKIISNLFVYLYEQYIIVTTYRKKLLKRRNLRKSHMNNNNTYRKMIKFCNILIEKIFQILGTLILNEFDINEMEICLRNDLNYKNMIFLMNYLYYCHLYPMKYTSLANKPVEIFNNTSYALFDFHLIKWFGVICNAKVSMIVTSLHLELVSILYDWNEIFSTLITNWENLSDLSLEIIHLLKLKENEVCKNTTGINADQSSEYLPEYALLNDDYSIQTVHLY